MKEKLSACLRRAAAGEHITVTDRGRPIAVLGPPIGTIDLEAAAEAGRVTARRLGTGLTFLTFDVRQAQAARSLGFSVAGA